MVFKHNSVKLKTETQYAAGMIRFDAGMRKDSLCKKKKQK